ncbi:hypothetical protein QF032_007162 [Streptomyces achromogenes]|uniref:Uncharacterized protein n=1 Tax=Streptomyces achromogenes TaxID=67255 RepID=A0ABU0QD46_STRAH|nr:hypothetical protein [Streptomyces achromogenes]MDQ0688121.1 hypothetical protein [Streptomyces achromogenes]MDQ0835318.1 hypothetical protein [Streptomyces achromogenes]
MTSQLEDKPAIRRPETGWARARRTRCGSAAPRTCLPAVAAPGTRSGPEGNIVRGDD